MGDHGQRLVSGWSPGSRPSAAAIASGPVVRLVLFFRLVPRWRDVCRRWIEQRDGPAQKTRGLVGCGVPESSATISADVRTDGPPGGLLSDLPRAMTAAALRAQAALNLTGVGSLEHGDRPNRTDQFGNCWQIQPP